MTSSVTLLFTQQLYNLLFGLINSIEIKEIMICLFVSDIIYFPPQALIVLQVDQKTVAWPEQTALWHAFTTKQHTMITQPHQNYTHQHIYIYFFSTANLCWQKVSGEKFLLDKPGVVKNSSPIGFFEPLPRLPSLHYISHSPLNLIITARVPALDLRMAMGLR